MHSKLSKSGSMMSLRHLVVILSTHVHSLQNYSILNFLKQVKFSRFLSDMLHTLKSLMEVMHTYPERFWKLQSVYTMRFLHHLSDLIHLLK